MNFLHQLTKPWFLAALPRVVVASFPLLFSADAHALYRKRKKEGEERSTPAERRPSATRVLRTPEGAEGSEGEVSQP